MNIGKLGILAKNAGGVGKLNMFANLSSNKAKESSRSMAVNMLDAPSQRSFGSNMLKIEDQ